MMNSDEQTQYQPPLPPGYQAASPFASFAMKFGGFLFVVLLVLALIVSWTTFRADAPLIITVVVGLFCLGALYLAVAGLLELRHRHRLALQRERHRQDNHAVQLHLLQTRVHPDERGNRPALISASGTVINLPSGNFVQPVAQHYAPHTVYHNPRPPMETRIEELPTNVPALGPAPSPVPTLAELLARREIVRGEPTSILGYTDGEPRRGDWDKLHSFFVAGISGSGKSSTVAYYIALAVLHGARLLVIDPDADEPEGISNRIAPLSFAFLSPVVDSPAGVERVLAIAERELANPSPWPLVWIVDEFTTIMRAARWSSVAQKLAVALEDYAQRGRKRRRTAIVIGQITKATRTGGTELRSSMAATFVHRLPAQQARMVIDAETAKDAPQLEQGEVMVQLANAVEPYRMTIPYTSEADMHTVARLVLPSGSPGSRPTTRPAGGDDRSSAFTQRSGAVQESFTDRPLNGERNTVNAPVNAAERVRALWQVGSSKRAIIREVWGATPGGTRAWIEASEAYDDIVGQIVAEEDASSEEEA